MVSTTSLRTCERFYPFRSAFHPRNPFTGGFYEIFLCIDFLLGLFISALFFLDFYLTSEQAAAEALIRAWTFLWALLLSWTAVVHLLWQVQPLLAHTAALRKKTSFFFSFELRWISSYFNRSCSVDGLLLYYVSELVLHHCFCCLLKVTP